MHTKNNSLGNVKNSHCGRVHNRVENMSCPKSDGISCSLTMREQFWIPVGMPDIPNAASNKSCNLAVVDDFSMLAYYFLATSNMKKLQKVRSLMMFCLLRMSTFQFCFRRRSYRNQITLFTADVGRTCVASHFVPSFHFVAGHFVN